MGSESRGASPVNVVDHDEYVSREGAVKHAEGNQLAATPKKVELTGMMVSLNEQARQKAKAMICRKFQDPQDLEDLSILTNQLQKQSVVAASQLNVAVQSKLEALKRAADLMDESSIELSNLSKTMHRIDERIEHTNSSISNYANLRRVHNVRDNVGKVLTQIDFFARVPERVRQLGDIITSEPTRLKEVFLESLRLESLRVALLKEIKISRGRRNSIIGGGGNGGSSTGLVGSEFSNETGSRIRKAVENHLHIVPDLGRHIRQQVMGTIDDMFNIAEVTPQDLVAAFEIIEMQQEYYDRRLEAARKLGESEESVQYEPITEIAQARIRSILHSKVFQCFTHVEEHAKEKNMTDISVKLGAASEVLSIMSLFKVEVVHCVPPSYKIMDIFMNVFEEYFVPKAKALCGNDVVQSLGPAELLQLVDWFEFFQIQVGAYNVSYTIPCVEEFKLLSEDLMNEYLDRIKHQVMQWFENIKKLPLEARRNTDNTVVTTNPEEMFRCLHLQIEVAKDKLPRDKLKDVVMACLQVLRQIQRDTYDALSSGYKNIEPELMCATINDNQRMQEKCDEFLGQVIELVPQEKDRDILYSVLEDVSNEYIDIAVKASNLLAKSLLLCDLEEVFTALFTQDWESGEGICEAIPATLYECFKDLEEWLSEFFFAKVLVNVLNYTVEFYMQSLLTNCSGDKNSKTSKFGPQNQYKFKNELIVANQINNDSEALIEFFESYSELLRRGGLLKEVKEEFSPLINLTSIFRAPHFSGAEKDAKSLFERFGADGLKIVHVIVSSLLDMTWLCLSRDYVKRILHLLIFSSYKYKTNTGSTQPITEQGRQE